MLAVIKTGGKQYLVKEGDIIKIEKIEGKVGKKISFDEVLLLADEKGEKVEIGQPIIKKVKVKAEILEQGKDKKILVVKYKPKTRYRRKKGHRQPYTKVKILEILS
ncbi:MAG: 50S ribosomal protein L21 [Patescibacteria group bacterium]